MAVGYVELGRPDAGRSRVRRAAAAVLLALLASLAISVAAASGSSTVAGRLGGDYPAFYAAGSLVAHGHGPDLYDPARQADAQRGLFGGEGDAGYLSFAYPPHVALVYAPLAALPYRASYALATALAVGALALALALLRPVVPVVRRAYLPCLAGTLAFFPMWRAVGGGQNTAFTLLLLALAWRMLHDDCDAQAGVALGLLLGKPQYALPVLGLLLVARRWRVLPAAVATAASLWVIGAMVSGPDWVRVWWRAASTFGTRDAAVNGENAISWLGVGEHLLGPGSGVARLVAGALVVATVAVAVRTVHRRPTLATVFAVAAPTTLLVAPHAMSYDAGLVALTLLAIISSYDIDAAAQRTARAGAAAVWVGGFGHVLAGPLGTSPLVAIVAGAFALATRDRP